MLAIVKFSLVSMVNPDSPLTPGVCPQVERAEAFDNQGVFELELLQIHSRAGVSAVNPGCKVGFASIAFAFASV